MQLSADQELRRELLLVSLNKQPDLEGAINLAAQMEQFVLRGSCTKNAAVDGSASSASSAANGAEHSPGSTDNGFTKSPPRLLGRETSGHTSAKAAANGSVSAPQHPTDSPAAPGGKKRRWSSGDDERLRRLWQSDHSLEEIAEAMGRTTPSLYSRARALGMSKRSPVVDNREAARPNHGGRESASGGAAPASTSEDDISGKSGHRAHAAASKARRQELEIKRYSSPCNGGWQPARLGSALGSPRYPQRGSSSAGHSFQTVPLEAGIEPIVHFLRSRDYSVVRVEDGRFKLDGRQILNADELREKANKVRLSLGKAPFVPQSYGPAG